MIWTTRPRSEGAGALHFFEAGSGPVLVLIHGVGLRAEAWNGMVPFLTDRFRTLCVDMPGHGASPLQGAYDLEHFLSRLGDFVDAQSGPVHLVGHSMGALLSVELSRHLPEKVASVAALNTVFQRSPEAAQAVKARAHSLSRDVGGDPGPTLARWFGADPNGELLEAATACRTWLTEGDREGYAAAYRLFAHLDGPSDATLSALRCPALFLTGAEDPNSTPAMSQALAARCGGHWAALEDAAHMMPMTHAAAVSALILRNAEVAQSSKD